MCSNKRCGFTPARSSPPPSIFITPCWIVFFLGPSRAFYLVPRFVSHSNLRCSTLLSSALLDPMKVWLFWGSFRVLTFLPVLCFSNMVSAQTEAPDRRPLLAFFPSPGDIRRHPLCLILPLSVVCATQTRSSSGLIFFLIFTCRCSPFLQPTYVLIAYSSRSSILVFARHFR